MKPIIETVALSKRFRGLHANSNINLSLEEGEVRCVIGPNGAGKTTFISMISGHLAPTSGKILYRGEDVTELSVMERARRGIGRKFQTPSVFGGLTTYENVELAALARRLNTRERTQMIREVIELIRLEDQADDLVNHLSHGQRQWLEIGLLLAVGAQLLLLDEPTAGMTGEETHATANLVKKLSRERGLATIIIEHDINFLRQLSAPVTVLHLGRVLREGSYEDLAQDQAVRDIYLGYQ